MKNLTKKNLEILRISERFADSELAAYVFDYIKDKWNDYDNPIDIFTDVLNHGCQSGIVGSLVYYSDTVPFYQEHKEEINEMLYYWLEETGDHDPAILFGKNWHKDDPLAIYDENQNLLAWFGFEEMLRKIGYEFEDVSEHI